MLDWLWPAGQASHACPERPLRAMRTILGTPFAPLTRGQAATQLGFGVLAMAALVLMATTDLDHEKLRSVINGGLAGGLGGGGLVLVGMYGWRLEQLRRRPRSEEPTSELQSLMRISYAVFCLKKKTTNNTR